MSRILSVLCLILVLAGCSGGLRGLPPRDLQPATTLVVFCDGFHSGLLVDRQVLPERLNPKVPGPADAGARRSLHFGEEQWTTGADVTWHHACRLAFVPGRGVIQSDVSAAETCDVPGLDRERLVFWRFPVSQAGVDAVMQRLQTEWIPKDSLQVMLSPDIPTTLFTTGRDWSVYDNCHDFTADLLIAAGLHLPRHTIARAGVLRADLDQAVADLAQGGIRVIGP